MLLSIKDFRNFSSTILIVKQFKVVTAARLSKDEKVVTSAELCDALEMWSFQRVYP
jgi:hypothetical protein